MTDIEIEAVRLTAMLLTAEDWAEQYKRTPEQFAQLIKSEAKLQVLLTTFFKEMAKDARNFVNWENYTYQNHLDYDVDVVVNDEQIDNWDGNFIKVNLKVVTDLVVAGAVASETLYQIPLGISKTSANIQKLGIDQVAKLVGKKVLKNGTIVDNPNPDYNIMDTVRKDITQSVKTSLGLGETTDEAIDRIREIISDKSRAELIARTESVNAYQAGVTQFGIDSHAVGKEWLTAGATDVCADYAAEGIVPIDYAYGGNLQGPTAHPNCRCGRRLVYQEEWDSLHHS